MTTITETPAYRALGSFERFFWLLDHQRPLHFCVAAEVRGTAPVNEWINALNALKHQHPLLNVSINLNEYNSPVFTPEQGVPISLRIVQHTEGNSWEKEVEQELATRFNTSQAPLMRAVLYEYANKCVIILTAHHAIADGRSLSLLIRDLLNTMNGKFAGTHPIPLAMDHYASLSMDDLYKLPINETDLAFFGTDISSAQRIAPQVQTLELSGHLSQRIAQSARQQGVTVHHVLSAAVALASKELKPRPLRIMSPASIRETLGAGESLSLCITSGTTVFDLSEESDFWNTARFTGETLATVKSADHISGFSHALSGLLASGIDINGLANFTDTVLANEYMLSNLGVLSYGHDFGRLQLEKVWGPLCLTGYKDNETIGATSINGRICLALTTPGYVQAHPVLKLIEQILDAECAAVVQENNV